MRKYTSDFYKDKEELCLSSARQIVPWLLQKIPIKSVVDIGCGNGIWLSVFMEQNVKNVYGYDGKWIDKELLAIPPENFTSIDLFQEKIINRTADLTISLEVAEHLPECKSDEFISMLTKISLVVLFSAAIPGQGGTNHINEQWPGYWIRKFEKNGFVVVDCIRNNFWNNEMVESWYRQNMFIFIKSDVLENYQSILKESTKALNFDFVHPTLFLGKIRELNNPESYSLKNLFYALPRILIKKLKYKLFKS